MHYYATAGIPWYLIVDPDARSLQLFELSADNYKERAAARAGEVLALSEPVSTVLTPEELLPPR